MTDTTNDRYRMAQLQRKFADVKRKAWSEGFAWGVCVGAALGVLVYAVGDWMGR